MRFLSFNAARTRARAGLLAVVGLCCCAPDLRPGWEARDGNMGSSDGSVHSGGDASEKTAQIDARREDRWVYLDLTSGAEVVPPDPATSLSWDLGFQRFRIKLNGGASGPGQGAVAPLPGVPFEQVTAAPAEGYLQDAPPPAPETPEDLAFLRGEAWYSYESTTHVLRPRDITHVVRAAGGQPFKLRITGYYDNAGTSGYPGVRYAPLPAP